MGLETPLFAAHVARGAKMVDFGGWDLPLHFGSQVEEHHAVRRHAGVFDVSHMGIIDLQGTAALQVLRTLLANDAAKLDDGDAMYSCMLNENGGVIDDLIAYRLGECSFRLVVNAGTRAKDFAWIIAHARGADVEITERRDLAMLAVQGPGALALVESLAGVAERAQLRALKTFKARQSGDWFIARTGYTGEDGFEIQIDAQRAVSLWNSLTDAGAAPCGLGARDTLRLEAGMSLYGNDLDEQHHPLECGLGWTVAFDPRERNFIGRGALEAVRDKVPTRWLGLILEERGILRAHQPLASDAGPGEITSGGFAPTLNKSIGLARIPRSAGGAVTVDIRGRWLPALCVKPPFVRRGKILV